MSEPEARGRIAAQLPLEEKLRHASYSIDCSGAIDSTRAQVLTLAAKLRQQASSP
jgi:dephospho-CoA kinase